MRDLLDVSLADWDLTMAVNLRAPFLITQRAARIMAANPIPGGVIINICDAGVDGPWRKYPHHGISKSALWMLTQVSALSLGPNDPGECHRAGSRHEVGRARDITDEEWAQVGGKRSVLAEDWRAGRCGAGGRLSLSGRSHHRRAFARQRRANICANSASRNRFACGGSRRHKRRAPCRSQ